MTITNRRSSQAPPVLPRPWTQKTHDAFMALRRLNADERFEVFAEVLATPTRKNAPIDVTPFRERFLVVRARHEIASPGEVAERLGWIRPTNGRRSGVVGDEKRLLRTLGLQASLSGTGPTCVQRHTSYEIAVALCDALDMDPHEGGV